MKLMGTRRGVPDLMLFLPRGEYAGLAMELKTEKGRTSDEQDAWIAHLESHGWFGEIIRNTLDGLMTIETYLDEGEPSWMQ